jgi:shikimate dehydrogenase
MIDASTGVYCIIGKPVRHSFSPAIQNAAFKEKGINAVYTAFEVNDAGKSVSAIRDLGINGASVTIPYKVAVIPFLDGVSELAGMIGSVNTLINKDGKIMGDNTDAGGFYRALTEKTAIDGKIIALFGAGGAGRAILFALFYYARPEKVYLIDSDRVRVGELIAGIGKSFAHFNGKPAPSVAEKAMDDWRDIKDGLDIVINATPVGMEPDIKSSVLTQEEIPEGRVLMDIVYRPHETALIKAARNRHCTVVYGADMLLYQGALQFELWTGLEAPIDVMHNELERKIYG